MCIFDLVNHFSLKAFYCSTIDDIHRNMDSARGLGTTWECKCYRKKSMDCPIFFTLEKNRKDFPESCPDFVSTNTKNGKKINVDYFWNTIRLGFLRYNQSTYFEIIFIQLFILGLISEEPWVRAFGYSTAIIVFLFPYLLLTYFKRRPLAFFENRKLRLVFAVLMWFIVFGASLSAG